MRITVTSFCRLAFLCGVIALSACDSAEKEEPAPNLLQSQQEALDKAKAVEGQLQEATEQRMQQLEQQN